MLKLVVCLVVVLRFLITSCQAEVRSEGDFYYLVEAIYHEAGNQPFVGRVAVAQQILHRVNSKHFGDSIEAVVHKYIIREDGVKVCQYSYYCDGKPDKMLDEKTKAEIIEVAEMVLLGLIPDLVGKADHYFNPELVLPSWASKMVFIIRIGDHSFYRFYFDD